MKWERLDPHFRRLVRNVQSLAEGLTGYTREDLRRGGWERERRKEKGPRLRRMRAAAALREWRARRQLAQRGE